MAPCASWFLQLIGQVARKTGLLVAEQGFQPNVFGGIEMHQRLPNRTLPNRKALAQLCLGEFLSRVEQLVRHQTRCSCSRLIRFVASID